MDVLELRLEAATFSGGAERQLVPYVNGSSLLALPVRLRKTKAGPHRRADRLTTVGAGHAGLAVYEGTAVDVSHLEPRSRPHDAAVLGCACGETGCSPVLATISSDAVSVTWLVAGHEFRFERRQYERALARPAWRAGSR